MAGGPAAILDYEVTLRMTATSQIEKADWRYLLVFRSPGLSNATVSPEVFLFLMLHPIQCLDADQLRLGVLVLRWECRILCEAF